MTAVVRHRHRPPTLAERTAARCRRAAAAFRRFLWRFAELHDGEPRCKLCGCGLDAMCEHECCDPATGTLPAADVDELTGQWDDLPGHVPGCVTEYWPDGPNGRDVGELEPLPAPDMTITPRPPGREISDADLDSIKARFLAATTGPGRHHATVLRPPAEFDAGPDWYDPGSDEPNLCPACKDGQHCDGATSFCECACGLPADWADELEPLPDAGQCARCPAPATCSEFGHCSDDTPRLPAEPLPAPVAAALAGRLAAAISPGTAAGYWTPRAPVGWLPPTPQNPGRPDVDDLSDTSVLPRLIDWAVNAPLAEVTG